MEQSDDITNARIHQLEVKLWVERRELALLGPTATRAAREVYGAEVSRLQHELSEALGRLHASDRG